MTDKKGKILRRLLRFTASLSAAAIVLFQNPTVSATSETENFHRDGVWGYTILDDSTAALSNYFGNETSVIIPDTLGGYTVAALGGGWYLDGEEVKTYGNIHEIVYGENGMISDCKVYSPFSGNDKIVSVTIPDSVNYIGAISFQDCTSLKSVVFGKNVQIIGNNSFEGCTSLTSAELPKSVALIDQHAFYGCESLKNASVKGGKCEASAFEKCSAMTEFDIPASWGCVPAYCFKDCSAMTDVTVSEGISEIGDSAFSGCTFLEEIVLPDSVTTIHSNAFLKCESLKTADLGGSVDTIGNYAFADCGLESLTVPESLVRIGDSAFGMTVSDELIEGFTLNCPQYSAAQSYAADHGIACITDTAETSLSSRNNALKVIPAGNSSTFYVILLILALAAAAIIVLIIFTVKNKNDGNDETDEDGGIENHDDISECNSDEKAAEGSISENNNDNENSDDELNDQNNEEE